VELTEETMSEAMLSQPLVTTAEFDAFLTSQGDDSLWELVAGRIVAMTNPSEVHEKIVSNIGGPLIAAIDPERCHVYLGGVGVQHSEVSDSYWPRPDVVVRCGPIGSRNFVTDPLVVVEVLSPSTMDADRGEKLRFYKALPTMRHIVFIYQDQMRVEHYRRTDEGWPLEVLTAADEKLTFEAVQSSIPLRSVYVGVEPSNINRPAP
jgi:Uma2 family endonuclease